MNHEYKTYKVHCSHFTTRGSNKRCHTIFTVTSKIGVNVRCPECRSTITIDPRNSMEMKEAPPQEKKKKVITRPMPGTQILHKRNKYRGKFTHR